METDKQSYIIGEIVSLLGLLTDSSNDPVKNAMISVQVVNPTEEIIHIELVYSDSDGEFIDSFILTPSLDFGIYTIYVTASKAGYEDVILTKDFSIIESELSDFSISIEPKTQSFNPGDTLIFTVNIQNIGDFSAVVSLIASESSEHFTVTFSPNVVTPPNTSTMRIITSDNTPEGSYNIQISGNGDTITHNDIVTVSTVPVSGCLIATATYGSEVASEVQFLREYRDEIVMKTFSGREFMKVFNMWYYSFSPKVADFERRCEPIRIVAQYALYPLLGILQITMSFHYLMAFNHEIATIMAGFVTSSLIGLIYLSPLYHLSSYCVWKRYRSPSNNILKAIFLCILAGFFEITIGILFIIPILVKVGTIQFVITSLAFGVSTTKLYSVIFRQKLRLLLKS
ncbi:CFI-box-CTERM domain-containing protein [[Eubacterium] cellulosolvens]